MGFSLPVGIDRLGGPHRNFELLLTQIFCRRLNLEQGIVSLEVGLSYDLLRFIPCSTICSHPFPLFPLGYHSHFAQQKKNVYILMISFFVFFFDFFFQRECLNIFKKFFFFYDFQETLCKTLFL